MKLKAYVKKYEKSTAFFAKRVGLSRELIYAYYGRANPTLRNAIKLVKATGGIVDYKDLLVR